jgi:hypothetical protein
MIDLWTPLYETTKNSRKYQSNRLMAYNKIWSGVKRKEHLGLYTVNKQNINFNHKCRRSGISRQKDNINDALKKPLCMFVMSEVCKVHTIPILMHQMRISTNHVSSVMLRPKIWKSEMLWLYIKTRKKKNR